jgi:endonuclease/exonuclease/phosphatase family metal-dependent hydrolase
VRGTIPDRFRTSPIAGRIPLSPIHRRAAAAVSLFLLIVVAARASAPGCHDVVPESERHVEWITPAGAAVRAQLARWCDTVGPVLLEPTVPSVTRTPLDRLTVVTWNVHVGGGDVDALIAQLQRGDLTDGEPVTDFVLLLQETYRAGPDVPTNFPRGFPVPGPIAPAPPGAAREDVRSVAHEHGLAVLYAPSMRNGAGSQVPEDRGNAILSTLAIDDPLVVELPLERQRRVAASVTISGHTSAGAPWRLRIANVHLDTAVFTRGGPFRARRRQAEALIDALRAPTEIPTLVAGDFNTWMGEEEPAITLMRAAFPARPPHDDRQPTWTGALGLRARLDYVFARGVRLIDVRRLPQRFGSDHFPLVARVSF